MQEVNKEINKRKASRWNEEITFSILLKKKIKYFCYKSFFISANISYICVELLKRNYGCEVICFDERIK